MNQFTFFPLQSYWYKIAGISVFSLAFICFAIEKNIHYILISGYNYEQHLKVISFIQICSLYFVAFSKEKVDDDRVQSIRAKSFQVAFGVLFSIIISIFLVIVITNNILIDTPKLLLLITILGLGLYLIIFNLGLYTSAQWLLSNDTAFTNLAKYKLFYIIYIAASILILSIIIYL